MDGKCRLLLIPGVPNDPLIIDIYNLTVDLWYSYNLHGSPDGWAVWGVVVSTRWWLLVDHCVLRNWDRILVRAVKGLISRSRAGMVSICPLLWQRDVTLQQTNQPTYNLHNLANIGIAHEEPCRYAVIGCWMTAICCKYAVIGCWMSRSMASEWFWRFGKLFDMFDHS